MKTSLSRTAIAASLMLAFGSAHAADQVEASNVFNLGEINVSGSSNTTPATGGSKITREELDEFNRETVVEALDLLPGITTTGGGQRNERMMYLRGFDSRQVPVFIDGIPVYVSYDGYVDLARFTTYDLASIEVAKGFSSVLYGPNTLGGAINLISRKPIKAFEGNLGVGVRSNDKFNSNGTSTNLNLGTNQGMWYAQLGLSYLDRDAYTLSRDFRPTTEQPDRERRNAYSTDKKINIKVGLTPNATDEYSLNYIKQEGEKGSPPYAGTSINPNFWRWPAWDKESLYFISNTALGNDAYVKVRAYYDKFTNQLESWDDARYATMTRGSSFRSFYNDHTYGASLEVGTKLSAANQLKVSLHVKEDIHRENNLGEPVQTSRDRTTSIGIEDTHRLTEKLDLVIGGSYDRRSGKQAEKYGNAATGVFSLPVSDASAFNPQVGLIYQTSETGNAYLTVARKSRFPTIKDRYSYRMGRAIPNPDLEAEHATNYQLGFSEKWSTSTRVDASVFYSDIKDMIQSVIVAPSLCTTAPCGQMQNVGDVKTKGIELAVTSAITDTLELGGNYTYVHRANKSNPTVRLTEVPLSKFFVYAKWSITPKLDVYGNVLHRTHQYTVSNNVFRDTPAYTVANTKISYAIQKDVSLEAGVNNLFDRNYAYTEGFYEEGRNLFVNLNYRF